MKIEIDLPYQDSFKYTGDYRSVKRDENYLGSDGTVCCNDGESTFVVGCHPIMELKEPKPEPTLLERIEAAYEGKEVVLLDRKQKDGLLGFWPLFGFTGHTHAQSVEGFAGYVYQKNDESGFYIDFQPVRMSIDKEGTCGVMPVAALFSK